MKILIWLFPIIFFSGCLGYTSRDNELIGQVKRVHHETPMICNPYDDVDISLGVMRNGVGSMSTEDLVMWVPDADIYKKLSDAARSGSLVKIKYDEARLRACVEGYEIKSVEFVK